MGTSTPRAAVQLQLAVQYANAAPEHCPTRPQLRRWAKTALTLAGVDAATLVLRFVDEDEGRTLNHSFRQKNYATNVLTFPYDDADVATADIVICVPVIEREAGEQGKIVGDHYAHMVVHGILHALGYDHLDADEATEMETLETRILARFGIADPYQEN